jgi:ketosteroid isomerase-like protein
VHEPSLEEKVQLLWDHRQIEDCLNRYSRGFDRCDMEIAKSAYWPDALDDHPGFCGLAHAMCDHFDAYHKDLWESTQHHITNTQIEIDGDTAHAESYCFLAAKTRESFELVIVGGRYIRRLEKRDGEWRIAAAVLVADWSLDPDTAREMIATGAKGARDHTDVSYDRPLQVTRPRTDTEPEAVSP